MTYPNVRSGSPVLRSRTLDPVRFFPAPRAESAVPRTLGASPATDPSAANDDDGPRKWYQVRNPLWVIVIGMGVLLAVMALTVALG